MIPSEDAWGDAGMMPPLGDALTEQQLSDLLAYLHTL